MCGIAGICNGDRPSGEAEQDLVARMLELQRHRGPDGWGIHRRESVVLGHRRLSILDLTDCAAQPMTNEDTSVWVTFNGEIYNYRSLREQLDGSGHHFRSASDTEVLIHGYEEWGIGGLLDRLRGMFSFALYDAQQYTRHGNRPFLFLARDRMGIKPLYYSFDNATRRLIFASEVRALIDSKAVVSDLNQSALAAFLCLGSVPYPQTCRSRVLCLPPGSVLTFSRHECVVNQYWDLRQGSQPGKPLHLLLSEAVHSHLLADVPVGVFLSGGVDSAAVATLAAAKQGRPLSTLTVSFPETKFDEAHEAYQVASEIGSDHHEISVTNVDFRGEVSRFLGTLDQPTADGVNTYFVSRAARQLGLKVVLSGLGGDEVFFGYRHYRNLVQKTGALGLYAHVPSLLRVMTGTAASAFSEISGKEQWGRFEYRNGRSLNESLYLLVRGFFPPALVSDLLGLSTDEVDIALNAALEPLRVAGENGTADATRFQELEMRRYMHDQLLRDSDVFSMAHSVELRVPLLDHEVVEAARAIAVDRRVEYGSNKPRLVEAVPGKLIGEIARRPKRGFIFPFEQWLKQNADEMQSFALEGSLLNRKAVSKCWDRFRAGRLHWSRAWSTVVLRSFN